MPFLLVCSILFLVIALLDRLQGLWQQWWLRRKLGQLNAQEADYRYILERNLPAFAALSRPEQTALLNRIFCYRCSHTFHFVGLQENKEMAILISAAAAMHLPIWQDEWTQSARDFYILRSNPSVPSEVSHVHMDDPGTVYIGWEAFRQAIQTAALRVAG